MWLETAREVSEYWIHRQQLLLAVGRSPDLRADLLGPVLDALCWAYPYRLAEIETIRGATVRVEVTGAVERTWHVVRGEHWDLLQHAGPHEVAVARFDADVAWRLLTNNLDRSTTLDITGDPDIVTVVRRTRAIIGAPD
jgi:hypothetical protein